MGRPGWSVTQRFIFEQETSRAGTLPQLAFSVTMAGPVIYTFGNQAQKKKFLPRILSVIATSLLKAGRINVLDMQDQSLLRSIKTPWSGFSMRSHENLSFAWTDSMMGDCRAWREAAGSGQRRRDEDRAGDP